MISSQVGQSLHQTLDMSCHCALMSMFDALFAEAYLHKYSAVVASERAESAQSKIL